MGKFVDGVWRDETWETDARGGFTRLPTQFRERLSADGSSGFPAAKGRYHLYVSYACPWAHRTMITRALRGLDDAVGLTAVHPKMGDEGWVFSDEEPDPLRGARRLGDLYLRVAPKYTGRATVPVLWDEERGVIVNNESREIMRMLDTEMEAFAKNPTSLAPPELRAEIDRALDELYEPVNNGVYRAGFSRTQAAYEDACRALFAALDRWNAVLERQRYTCGERLTEADVALFTTLLRFDLVYYAHFKCNLRRVAEYPGLSRLLRELYAMPEVRATCRLDQIKTHYYWSQPNVNPTRIVPLGPHVDLR